jgi:hypothetical protein
MQELQSSTGEEDGALWRTLSLKEEHDYLIEAELEQIWMLRLGGALSMRRSSSK